MKTERPHCTVDAYLDETGRVLAETSSESIVMMVTLLYQAWEDRKQVFILGNGGSASTASHVVNDLSKATIVPGLPRMKVFGLADNVALMTAWANDTSYDAMFKEQLENLLEIGDVVIGISASGNSPNVLRAMEYSRKRGAVTVAWTGLSGGKLKDVVEHCLHVPTEDVGMIESVHLVVDHAVTRLLHGRIHAAAMDKARVSAGA
jgi:D-sedoheptulose 7-phosphate isomerase